MPINFRKAKNEKAICSNCKAGLSKSVFIAEYRIGRSQGALCDLCLKELFNKTLKLTCLMDKEKKDKRQIDVINSRKKGLTNKTSINEALKGIEDNEDLVE